MITKNIKAYIENDTLELSEQINVYFGDGDISLNMTLVGLDYELDQMYSDLKIVKPDGSDSVSSRLPVVNNILKFVITQTMIDESIEVGEHKLQIRLWDSAEGGNRVALPAFSFIANKELEGSNVILYTLKDSEDNELLDVANYSLLTTSSKKLNYTAEQIDDSVSKKHTHSNSTILDGITSGKVAEWNSKSDSGHTHTGYATTTDTTNLNNNKFDDVSISGAELSLKANGVVKKTVTLPTSGGTVEGHTHANKATLDNITDAKVLSWDNKSNFSGSYADLTNKPTIPTVTNDLTNTLKSNYDAAYTHSTSSHAPTTAQKNSDITKAEIESKLTGEITSHTHPNMGGSGSDSVIPLFKETTSANENEIYIAQSSVAEFTVDSNKVTVAGDGTMTIADENVIKSATFTITKNGIFILDVSASTTGFYYIATKINGISVNGAWVKVANKYEYTVNAGDTITINFDNASRNYTFKGYGESKNELMWKANNEIVNLSMGEQNVQADWNATDSLSDSFIKNKPYVTDNLTSTSATNVLSARQGKILDDKITQNTSSLAEITQQLVKINQEFPYMLTNPQSPLSIETYDGGNEAIHPKVLYFPNFWKGYKFWMVYTPYYNWNESIENPCIAVSNDGENWSIPNELTNPLDNITDVAIEHHSDPHLVYREDLNRLEVWYRHSLRPNNLDEKIYRKYSTDGINWSEKELLFESVGTEVGVVSPSVIWDENKYKIWFSHAINDNRANRVLRYCESVNGDNWQHIRDIKPNISTHQVSHLDVIKSAKGYEFIWQGIVNGTGTLECLFYSISQDNITYSNPIRVLDRSDDWDNDRMYRPSLTYVGNELWLYYCATASNRKWGTGLIKIPPTNENILDFLIQQNVFLNAKLNEYEVRINALESGGVAPEIIYGQIVLSKTTTTITENSTDTFTVKLDKAPTNNQVVSLSKNNNDVTLSVTSLTFTPSNYNTAQTVTINVAEDEDSTDETCTITLTSPNVTTKTLSVNITDNDGVVEPPTDLNQYLICDYSTLKINTDTNKNIWTDSKGSYNGTLNGFGYTASSGWTTEGLKLDGNNDYILNNVNDYLKVSTNNFTLQLKIKANTTNLNRRCIYSCGGSYLGLWISDSLFGTTNAKKIILRVADTNLVDNDIITTNDITDNDIDIVITKSGNTLSLYVDKTLINSKTISIYYDKMLYSVIGAYKNSSAPPIKFDDSLYKLFRVYNKSLTQEEINTL